jgi:hypothetical protein
MCFGTGHETATLLKANLKKLRVSVKAVDDGMKRGGYFL